jgi:ABC-2 type transport system permease protein
MTVTTVAIPVPAAAAGATRRSRLGRVWHQLRYDWLVMMRNREARFFTLALPVLMLLLFVAIFGNEEFEVGSRSFPGSTYYVANQVVFGIVDAAMMTTAVAIIGYRELGILKRRRATPQPAWVLVVSRALLGVLMSLVLAGVLIAVGGAAFGIGVPLRTVPALVAAITVGAFSFCALGFAASTIVRTNESATPTMMGLTLPLFFISGVFVPWFMIPSWLRGIAEVFPVRHLAALTMEAFTSASGSGFRLGDLLVVAAWGLGGLVVAARRFKWAPQA